MQFPAFITPDFSKEPFRSAPDVRTEAAGNGFLPEDFYATTIYPEYFKIGGMWKMLHQSRMDSVVVIRDDENAYRVIPVSEWIENDESLQGARGY